LVFSRFGFLVRGFLFMDATSGRESSNGMIRHHMQSLDTVAVREYEVLNREA
jgi:hypothetical protein